MAIKHNYTPFMKFKVNEVAGLSVIDGALQAELGPFFDLPRKTGMNQAEYLGAVAACRKKADRYLHNFAYLYIDCFDIPDSIATPGMPNCRAIIEGFAGMRYVPVLGLDRAADHNVAILTARKAGEITSNFAAIRFQYDEFSSFELIEDELADLISEASKEFDSLTFVYDCRVCLASNRSKLATDVASFAAAAASKFGIDHHIVTGSSVPATITDIARPSDESVIARAELEIFHAAHAALGGELLSLGDYTIVSPTYSELTIAPELMLSVTAPKVFYTFENYHYIARGGRIKTQGYGQYDSIAEEIIGKSFFRGAPYSWGDNFIKMRADGYREKNVTPSTILKPTICAHITYMATHYPA